MTILDLKNLDCPLPLLKLKVHLRGLELGELVIVFTTDSASLKDFAVFCECSQHSLIETHEHDDFFEFKIKKG